MNDSLQDAHARLLPAITSLSPRKHLLAYVAFARHFESLFPHGGCHHLLSTAEQVADGEQNLRELSLQGNECLNWFRGHSSDPIKHSAAYIACELGFYAKRRGWELAGRLRPASKTAADGMFHTMLYWLRLMGWEQQLLPRAEWFEQHIGGLLEVCQDLTDPSVGLVAPQWVTDPVSSIANTMYDSRDFSPMPILADALEDAGCDNADILSHCRAETPHVRGCWVVDQVLGKS